MRKLKYEDDIRIAINVFWRGNRYPPTLRDIMRLCNINSTSVVRYTIRRMDDIRLGKNSQPIPRWVDNLFGNRAPS